MNKRTSENYPVPVQYERMEVSYEAVAHVCRHGFCLTQIMMPIPVAALSKA
jgi:hypothetical protein